MTATATSLETLKSALDEANPNKVASALQQAKLGTMLTPLKKTYSALAATAAHNLTDVAHGSGLAALLVGTLRVTAGAAAAGARLVTDAGGTPSATVATLSDDGKTVTFEGTVTAFVIEYVPRASADMTGPFAKAS